MMEINFPETLRVGKVMVFAAGLAMMLGLLFITAKPANAKTFTVNYTGDGPDAVPGNGSCNVVFGLCSLRAAIEEANAFAGPDTINFNIFGSGPHTIAPDAPLSQITGPVTIDGYSQSGASPNALAVGNNAVLKVELSGVNAGPDVSGLTINAANSTVKGLVINQWDGSGVEIIGSGAKGNKVQGTYIGTDKNGTAALGNGLHGVVIGAAASDNMVGGTQTAARNIISGNDINGVSILSAKSNKVTGNYVGTDKNGTADLGNSLSGVMIFGAASDNTIGGTEAAARNIISANAGSGVTIFTGAEGNEVLGNYIGTDKTGTLDLGNDFQGVRIDGASNNAVGGTTAAARNIISANDQRGVTIEDADATGNKVRGNFIGTDKNGTADLGNFASGVFIGDAPDNTVGGTTAAARNIISGNDGSGVDVFGASATGNHILSNSINDNAALGIDLGNDGVTANDADDGDTGPNNFQNYPILNSATIASGTTTIKGTLNSTANTSFTLRFFSSLAADPSGFGEGEKFKGQKSLTTDSSGDATFTFKTKKVPKGQFVSATATNQSSSATSEFSLGKQVL
jgi:CSLREA domain-containing protein